MPTKDYYEILELPYTATGEDIRRAFRKLAFTYHPDKNNGDKAAEEKFKEVQEAYFILSDAERRETYHLKSIYPLINRKNAPKPVTAHGILYRCQRLNDQIAEMDIFRMSQQALFEQIISLISDRNISIIHKLGDEKLTRLIITELIKSSRPLAFNYVEQVNARLALVAGTHNETITQIFKHTKTRRRLNYWERYNSLVIFIITILLCFFIWKLNR